MGGGSINSMVLGGLALAFSRLIDNSVVVLENIYRHLELGESPAVAAEKGRTRGGAARIVSNVDHMVVFFPVTFLYGVSKFLFTALALAVGLSLFASFAVAMDGGAPLLRSLSSSLRRHHGTSVVRVEVTTDHPRSKRRFGEALQRLVQQPLFESFLHFYDASLPEFCDARDNVSLGSAWRSPRALLASAPGTLLLSPNRCRPVRH